MPQDQAQRLGTVRKTAVSFWAACLGFEQVTGSTPQGTPLLHTQLGSHIYSCTSLRRCKPTGVQGICKAVQLSKWRMKRGQKKSHPTHDGFMAEITLHTPSCKSCQSASAISSCLQIRMRPVSLSSVRAGELLSGKGESLKKKKDSDDCRCEELHKHLARSKEQSSLVGKESSCTRETLHRGCGWASRGQGGIFLTVIAQFRDCKWWEWNRGWSLHYTVAVSGVPAG